jgi:hypothetical protein
MVRQVYMKGGGTEECRRLGLSGLGVRSFGRNGQARSDYPMLNDLLPGVVYGIDNNAITVGNPRPVAKMSLVRKNSG